MRYLFFIVVFGYSTLWAQQPEKIKIAKEACIPALLQRKGGNITKAELQTCDSIFIRGSCNYKIISYSMVFCFPGVLKEIKGYDKKFTTEIKDNLQKLEFGNRLFVEEIKVMNEKGQILKLPDLIFKVSQYP